MDWIQGDKFIELANWKFAPPVRSKDDYDHLENTLVLSSVKDGDIIYTHSMYANQLLEVLKDFDKKIVLITHNGDTNITNTNIPNCVVAWFAQNVAVKHEKLFSIPIGLQNNRWSAKTMKKQQMVSLLYTPKLPLKNFVYMNHKIKTNIKERAPLYPLFMDKEWITFGHDESFATYIENIYRHRFVICPDGNGVDTHRLWETLYMDSYPIVKRSINVEFYKELPMLVIDRWEDVEPKLLFDWQIDISEKTWNWDVLKFEYWANKIKNTAHGRN